MTHTLLRRLAPLARAARLTTLAVVTGTILVTACSLNDKLLSVDNPDLINPANLGSPDGAEQLRVGALDRWRLTTGGDNVNGQDNTWLFGGLLADEWATSSTFVQNDEVDERRTHLDNSTVTFAFRKLQRVRTAVNQALPYLRTYMPTATAKIAELYLARGFAEMQLASDFCNGIPLSDGTQPNTIIEGQPLKDSVVFNIAVSTIDSGLAILGTPATTDTMGTRVYYALRVARARALLGNDRVAEALLAVTTPAAIPLSFNSSHSFSTANGNNAIWGQPNSGRRYLVGDSLEGNARNYFVANNIPFFSSKDPRVPSRYTTTVRSATKTDTTKSQDGLTNSRTTTLYAETTPVAVLNGIDARLIEAEGRLRAGDPAGMLTILNALRAAPPKLGEIVPCSSANASCTGAAMTPLAMPLTYDDQVSLLFREKAFWTFSRGQRLGDLRRLIRYYSTTAYPRTPDNTFPTGDHYRGGTYGTDVNFPVPQEEQNNSLFKGCIDRKA